VKVVALLAGGAVATALGVAAATNVFGGSQAAPSSYRPPPRQKPILGASSSPQSCDGWLRGNIVATCDPGLLQEVWNNHEESVPGKLGVTISGRRVRVGGNPAVTQVVPTDGSGAGLVPGSRVTLTGQVSAGSYLYLRAQRVTPKYVAFGEAIFNHLRLEKRGTATINVRLVGGKLIYDFRRSDGARLEPVRTTLQAGPGPRGKVAPLPAHEADTPEQAIRTYLAAINAHDGKTLCELFTPSARATFRNQLVPCWQTVSGHIGYGEESSTPLFQRVELITIGSRYTRTNYGAKFSAAPIDLDVHYTNVGSSQGAAGARLHDLVWFQQTKTGWRIAKASKTLYAAFSGNAPQDVLAPPDPLAALHRREQEAKKRRAEAAEYRRSRLTPVRHLLTCAGKETSAADLIGDVRVEGDAKTRASRPGKALAAGADLRAATVAVSGRTACATLDFVRRPVAGRISFSLLIAPRSGRPGTGDVISLDFAKDGLHAGRLINSENALDPKGVELGIAGSNVSIRFQLGDRLTTINTPELKTLVWRVSTTAGMVRRPFLAEDVLPSDRRGHSWAVRQSDGRLVQLY
jgi:hypothetical protein